METVESLELVFIQERETVSTWRYKEETVQGKPQAVGTLYLKKEVVVELGNPGVLVVNIKSGD